MGFRWAFVRATWSGLLPFANPGAVFSFAGWGRWGPILNFMLSPHEASVSTLFSGVLDIAGVYWPLGEVVVGAGHGPVLLLVQSVGTIGFAWDPVECV